MIEKCLDSTLYEEAEILYTKATKPEPIEKRVYECLTNFVGAENAISASKLSDKFLLSERELRSVIHKIRKSTEYHGVISSCNKGYFLCTEEEFERANKRLERQALSLLSVSYANKKKAAKDGQFVVSPTDYCNSVIKAFGQTE